MNLKEKYIQFCCDFYNEHAPEDKVWFGRMFEQCQEDYEQQNRCMYRWQFPLMILKDRQTEIDQLNVKNNQLTHALVNTNAEKAKWAKDYWSQVERSAEYGAMLMTDTDSLEFKCFQKEKKIEELAKQLSLCREENKGLVEGLNERQKRIDGGLAIVNKYSEKRYPFNAFCDELEKALRGANE